MWSMGQQPGCHLELVKKAELGPTHTYRIRTCILSRVLVRFNERLSSVLPPTHLHPHPHSSQVYALNPFKTHCRSLGGVRGGMKKTLLTWDLQFGAHQACSSPSRDSHLNADRSISPKSPTPRCGGCSAPVCS